MSRDAPQAGRLVARHHLVKIVTGGQTGVDRAALDWAIRNEIRHGGWCPRGRRAEDGRIPSTYALDETPSDVYAERTLWNVLDADGVLVVSVRDELQGGSLAAVAWARLFGRPLCHVVRTRTPDPVEVAGRFIVRNEVRVLNVVGPRVSEEPEAYAFASDVLDGAMERAG